MVQDKVRIRFRKDGDLRFVSHHDLMRSFERMLRRAGLPFRSTSGFNPKPRLVFALSLPLGVVGSGELVDLELDAEVAPDEVRRRLEAQAPEGLSILDVRRIERKQSAQVRLVRFHVPVREQRKKGLADRIQELLQADSCWVERTRPHRRRIDLRPYLSKIQETDGGLEMQVVVTTQGTARPDEILRLLGLGDLIDEGVIIERTAVILEGEVSMEPPILDNTQTDQQMKKESHEERNAH
jgi:radical SAM-linked protein